jgi:Protein of unknown function (DUF2939)
MRWILRIAGILAVAWLLFLAAPFIALHNFAREVEARDIEAIRDRVNFRAVRISLLKQVMGVVVQEKGGRAIDPGDRQLAVEVGASLADPVVAQLLTPEAIVELLNGVWPGSLRGDDVAGAAAASPPSIVRELRLRSANAAWRLFRASELRGFRSIIVSLPPDRDQERQVRLRLRLARGSWKLVNIELPPALLQELARRLPGPARQGQIATPPALLRA